jgi:DnaA family protein
MRQLALALTQPPEPSLDNFVAGPNAELIERLREAARGEKGESVIYLWGAPGSGLIAVDDVDRLDEARQIALFNLINHARESGGTVLAAGNAPPAQLALRADLGSRLGWGLVYQLRAPDDADKALHLRAEARRRGLELSDEVLDYLLARLPRDLRSLVAIVERLDRHSLERRRPLTVPLAREALREADGQP